MSNQNRVRRGVLPLPEVVSSFRRDWIDGEKWNVHTIADPADSKSNIVTHEMEVSSLNDEVSRFYRQRELVRARISFANAEQLSATKHIKGINTTLVMAAEECRINLVCKKLGFQTDLIKNGSEKQMGERFVKDGSVTAWNQSVAYGLSLANTKAFNSFLTGIRSVRPEWATTLRRMHDELTKFRGINVSTLASTYPSEYELTTGKQVVMAEGFHYTIQMAKRANNYLLDEGSLDSSVPGEKSETKSFETSTSDSGKFAPLVVDKSVPLNVTVKGFLHRKKVSASTGKRILYPDRLLTDPHRKVFGSKIKANGGVVLIDTSGSMQLEEEDIESILTTAPGALIMAYSHQPFSVGIPNLFILADRGKRVKNVSDVPYRNGGNGVDGPALEYAIKRRKKSEPLIWICDGVVTSSSDAVNWDLTEACAKLVIKHKIVVIPDVPSAVECFKRGKLISRPRNSLRMAIDNLKQNKR